VGDVEVKDSPDEREAAGLAGEAADHLGAAFDLGERAFEQVGRAPSAAVSGRVAQVHDERVEVVGEAFGGGGVAGTVELVDERLQALLCVALAGGVIERRPVGQTHALALGQLGEQVPQALVRCDSRWRPSGGAPFHRRGAVFRGRVGGLRLAVVGRGMRRRRR
jgi:hypothetical protein